MDESEIAELQARVAEAERERDAAEARAQAAETRAQELGALSDRVEVAERRALDAERRLQELSDQVHAGRPGSETPEEPLEPVGSREVVPAANDLRARLARTAARKKPGNGPDPT
jgi:predicted  nucleic acid-binding Zn-ribbon protein